MLRKTMLFIGESMFSLSVNNNAPGDSVDAVSPKAARYRT